MADGSQKISRAKANNDKNDTTTTQRRRRQQEDHRHLAQMGPQIHANLLRLFEKVGKYFFHLLCLILLSYQPFSAMCCLLPAFKSLVACTNRWKVVTLLPLLNSKCVKLRVKTTLMIDLASLYLRFVRLSSQKKVPKQIPQIWWSIPW